MKRLLVVASLIACAAGFLLAQSTKDNSGEANQSQASDSAEPASADEVRQLRQLVMELQARVERLESEKNAEKNNAAQPSVVPDTVSSQSGAATAIVAAQTVAPSETKTEKPSTGPFDGLLDALGGATLTGFADVYYNVNFNNPIAPPSSITSTGGRISGLRTWDAWDDMFTLNMIQLALDKPPDPKASRAGYHVALMFGSGMNVLNNAEPQAVRHNLLGSGWDQYLMEGYFSYLAPVGKGLRLDVGKFVTPMGAEVIPTKDNWNYTRGLLFDFAIPFYHFGLRTKYVFDDKVSLSGYAVNGWNNVIDNNTGKSFIVSLGLTPTKKLTINQNYMAGPETDDTTVFPVTQPLPFTPAVSTMANNHWRQLVDTTVAYAITPKVTLQTNFDYGRGDRVPGIPNPVYWTGSANYVHYTFRPQTSLTVRYEYYLDANGFTTGTAQHINEVTGTLERRFGQDHLISRAEFRRDMSNQTVFLNSLSVPKFKDQNTFTVGLIYTIQKSE